ncbi:MAG: hypothetical protein OHK0039_27710 [Bacteroidia bacterium]
MFLEFLKQLEFLGLFQLIFVHLGTWNLYSELIFDIIPLLFYARFVQHFLHLPSHAPQTHRRINWFVGGIMVLLGLNLLWTGLGWHVFSQSWFGGLWLIHILGSYWFMVILYRNLNMPHAQYIMLGTSFLLLGAAIALIFLNLKRYVSGVNIVHPLILLRIGFLLEVFCFSYTLGLRMRNMERAKIQAEQLVSQGRFALLQTEMRALQAQINPHFVANCLNSIKSLIQQSRLEEAIDYLVRFSRLIRVVVDYSLQPNISLRQELQLSRLYVELESLRLGQSFRFDLDWEHSEADIDFVKVPPFLLQPFLENAIWHGFRHKKEGDRVLRVWVEERPDALICFIDDNGVGRAQANKYPREKPYSIGIGNVEERLDLINQLEASDFRIKIIDKTGSDGQPLGTQVQIWLGH